MNIHASFLNQWPGARAIEMAIPYSGGQYHFVGRNHESWDQISDCHGTTDSAKMVTPMG